MENLWIPVTLMAALVQTGRNTLMKQLKNELSDDSILFGRFVFALPIALLVMAAISASGYEIPTPNRMFYIYSTIGGIAQFAGGMLFLNLLRRRHFVIGVTYSQINSIMKVVFSAILFSEFVSLGGLFAIVLSFFGIVMITIVEKHIEPKKLWQRLLTPSAIIGLGCGTCFGLTGVLYREAILILDSGNFFARSILELVYVLSFHSAMAFILMMLRNRKQLGTLFKSGRKIYLVGLSNSISTMCWMVAFSLAHAAYVSMLAQVEVLFSILLSHNLFKEKMHKLELLGMFIIVASVIMLLWLK